MATNAPANSAATPSAATDTLGSLLGERSLRVPEG
jgi:hypothetical protein